ncbi:MAG: penicillin-binding protein 2 [Deltaproteobacteria bacterium RBG_13_58_19]|nr:MAG: penicillin-binding protein 2 [Deltaproteobacteria bacterium RBG_13_58_19]
MSPEEQDRARRTFSTIALVILFLFGLLFLRLWFLQLVEGEDLKQRSEFNRIRLQDLPPWRGMILDKNGQVLVSNRPSFDLVVVLEDVTDIPLLARRLGSLLKLEAQQVILQLEGARQAGFQTVRLMADLSWEGMALVESFKAELPGVIIQVQPKREYPHKSLACHVLGYLGEITEGQLKSGHFPNHKMGDYLGRVGIELAWEEHLRGGRGHRRIEVDAYGRELGQLENQLPTPGATVYLTMDVRLQQEAEACLQDKAGAIVALDPRNGKILAMASAPPFSQDAFDRGLTSQEWQALSKNKDHPLENRALKGQYPPGSTFKIVMALAALEEDIISPKAAINCGGSFTLGNHVFRCWKKGGHGSMDLYRGVIQSCDVYFYNLGKRLGIERIAKWSRSFGLGHPSGLKLDKEMPGLVASSAWKRARFKQPWQEGDTISVSIGQGYNLTTPLQMAQVAATVANGGSLYEPQLVERVESPAGEILFQAEPVLKGTLGAKPANVALLQKALRGVVAEGTGRNASLPHVEVAGKTGTSQVVALDKEKTGGKIPDKYKNHAWFVAYAPVTDPQVALAVLVEHGGGGGANAAPLAKRLLETCFPGPQKPPPPPAQEEGEEEVED